MNLRTVLARLPDNPIIERERRMRARSWAMPLTMSLYICVIGGWALLQFSLATSAAPGVNPGAAAMARAALLVAALQLVVILLAVPPVAANAISSERDRGMFDLLLLGRLSPRHIAWSELAASLSFLGLLVIVAAPVLLAAFLYAGLGVGQFLLAEVLTLASAVALGAIAIVLSTVLTRPLTAALATYGVALVLRFAVAMTGAALSATVPLNPAPGAAQAVYPLVFANPFYALQALLTGPSPAGAHLGHLVGLLVGRAGDPASWGPVVQPWQASLACLVALTLVCMAVATRVVAGRRPGSRARRLAATEIRLPRLSRRRPRTEAPHSADAGATRGLVPAVAIASVAAVVAVATLAGAATGQPVEPEPDATAPGALTVTAAPRWGYSTPGAWTPYLVTMTNSGTDFEGEVVLFPETTPPPPPPSDQPPDAPPPRSSPELALGATEFSVPPGPEGPLPPGDFPTHRTPVALAAGEAPRSVIMLVVEAPYGYRAELQNRSGDDVAVSLPAGRPQGDQTETVALLGGNDDVAATLRDLQDLRSGSDAFANPISPIIDALTVLASGRDVPDSALMLSGLQTLVIHNFDTATLSARQLDAVHNYVALGGALVLTGGSEATGMLRDLPEELVPLEPSGTTSVSMSPLTDLVARTTTANTTAITGELRTGRTMLATADGIPLVVEASYGAGRVVQLAYDPEADALAADPVLHDLAWQQAIPRALHRFGENRSAHSTPSEQLWSPAIGDRPWPGWPAPALWLLAGYALLGAPLAYRVLRGRRRPVALWAAGPLVAVVVAVFAGVAAEVRDGGLAIVQVSTVAAGDVVLTSSYRGRQATGAGVGTINPGEEAGASTVFAPPSLVSVAVETGLSPGGTGEGVVDQRAGELEITVPSEPGQVRSLELVTIERRPAMESELRLVGSGPPEQGGLRLLGTVTNHGADPIRRLRAQLPEGAVARIAEVIEPGETLAVDTPFVWPTVGIIVGSGPLAQPDELVMFAAAARAFTRSGQVVIVGMGQNNADQVSVVMEVVPLESAEQVIALGGAPILVANVPHPAGGRLTVYELHGLPGLTAAEVAYDAYNEPPEVYDWATRTWRRLPAGDTSRGLIAPSPLTPSEVRDDGVVRVRASQLVEASTCCSLTNPIPTEPGAAASAQPG